MPSLPPAYPHDPLKEIADDVFMVHGSIRMNPLVRICRNMVIVRRAGELTLINPVRLNDVELERLESLGRVTALVRLGALHGSDDAFYKGRFGCELWCQPGQTDFPEPAADRVLEAGGPLPVDAATLFSFDGAAQPESALLLQRERLLLTCDALQHYGDYSQCNALARLLMPLIGFPRTTIVGPFWLKLMTPPGASLRSDFDRLLAMDFDSLLGAHGTLLERGAHGAVSRAVEQAFR